MRWGKGPISLLAREAARRLWSRRHIPVMALGVSAAAIGLHVLYHVATGWRGPEGLLRLSALLILGCVALTFALGEAARWTGNIIARARLGYLFDAGLADTPLRWRPWHRLSMIVFGFTCTTIGGRPMLLRIDEDE